MKVRWKVKKDDLKTFIDRAKKLHKRHVTVKPTGAHAYLVPIHEYGANVPVTPKMRAFLHSVGVHLRAETTHINIPERSFMRAGYDAAAAGILRKNGPADALKGAESAEVLLARVGLQLEQAIKDYARGLSSPPQKPFPGASGRLLHKTGAMVNGLKYEVH